MSLHNIPKEVLFEEISTGTKIGAGLGAAGFGAIAVANYKKHLSRALNKAGIDPNDPTKQAEIKRIARNVKLKLAGLTVLGTGISASVGKDIQNFNK